MKKKDTIPEIEVGYFEKQFNSLFSYHYDARKVFQDFITMCICTLALNPKTGKSFYEEDYLKAIEPYKSKDDVKKFSEIYAALILEMEMRVGSSHGNDVLGEFFEKQVATDRKAQFFTPWPICQFISRVTQAEESKTQHIIDPACGSGRMLLAANKVFGHGHFYYGIDVDPLCVKITAINLFLNGVFKGEVMCADALSPFHFIESYVLSFLPFRITRITEKEQSPLWNRHNALFMSKTVPEKEANLVQKIHSENGGSQLKFF